MFLHVPFLMQEKNMFNLFKKKQEIKLLQQQEEEMNKIVELQQTINELYREEKEILKDNFKTKRIKRTPSYLKFIEY